MSLGQSCITVVSCLSWQSRYFSPASMYSLHSWVCRLMTPALPLPRTLPLLPLSAAPDRGPLPGSADRRTSKRRRAARRRMMGRGKGRPLGKQVDLEETVVGWFVWRDAGGRSQLCVSGDKQRRESEVNFSKAFGGWFTQTDPLQQIIDDTWVVAAEGLRREQFKPCANPAACLDGYVCVQ